MTLTRVVRSMTINRLHSFSQYEYSIEKNALLIEERGIGFEDVIDAVERGNLLGITDHHNYRRYSHQNIFVVNLHGYAYMVPFVEKYLNTAFLKTVIPSRKLTKKYLGRRG